MIPRNPSPRSQRLLRIGRNIFLGIAALLVLVVIAAYAMLRASLPVLDGDHKVAQLQSTISIARDDRGTVSIQARSQPDAIRALGYVHSQERFFEMDLARRSAAGELSALLGAATLPMDKDKRRHRLRARMTAQWQSLPPADRAWVSAYTEGVNAGLNALSARPWQYFILRTTPEPWREVDSMLVVGEMYFMLQARGFEERFNEIGLRKKIGDRLFGWLKPSGGGWDAALDGSEITPPAMPVSTEFDTRNAKVAARQINTSESESVALDERNDEAVGSNNWAIGGALTSHGGAMLADDMHLGLGVPNIWFRTQISIGEGAAVQRVAGVTLPGLPAVVVGSNGHIAWGFTNGYGQWFDWVARPKAATGDKPAITTYRETIAVKGGENEDIEVRESPFGPILKTDTDNDYALSWVLYRDGGVNMHAGDMMFAQNVDDAIAIAHASGIPHQNVLIADKQGNVAWTIMGRIPRSESVPRQSTRGQLTPLAALPTVWLATTHYPLVKNPADARLWTANNRQLGPETGQGGDAIGDGGFDLGARAMQIRDRLRAQPAFDEKGLHAIHLDDESRFLKRWTDLAIVIATARANEKTTAIAGELKRWNGRADIDQTGHRIARAFRQQVMDQLWKEWLATAAGLSPSSAQAGKQEGTFGFDGKFEYPVSQALSTRPPHLLPKPHRDWDDFLAAQLAAVHDELVKQHGKIADATWGKRNIARIKHPFSRAMPFLSAVLDMPATPLAGDNNMPLVAAPTFGASQRMVVSPGHEEQAIFTMPGGQSGHPLSPFYGAGHDDWLQGKPTPLLAGETRHTLQLTPKR